MGKSILCEKLIELLPPDCPLHKQCSLFKGTCIVSQSNFKPEEEVCKVCHGYECYCDLTQSKAVNKPARRKKGKIS